MEERIINLNVRKNEEVACDFGFMEEKIKEVLKNGGNIAIFGAVGSGKTTVLKGLIKRTNEVGIVRNVYLHRHFEINFSESDEMNLVKIEKSGEKPEKTMKLLKIFAVERVFTEKENNDFDKKIISGCADQGVPICFDMYAKNIEMYKKMIEEARIKNIDLIIQVERTENGRKYTFFDEKLEQIKHQ